MRLRSIYPTWQGRFVGTRFPKTFPGPGKTPCYVLVDIMKYVRKWKMSDRLRYIVFFLLSCRFFGLTMRCFASAKIQTDVTLIQIWRVAGCRFLETKGLTSGHMRPYIYNLRTQDALFLSMDSSILLSIDSSIYLHQYKFICLNWVITIYSRIVR